MACSLQYTKYAASESKHSKPLHEAAYPGSRHPRIQTDDAMVESCRFLKTYRTLRTGLSRLACSQAVPRVLYECTCGMLRVESTFTVCV